MEKTLNCNSFHVLTIFILDEGSADLGTGQVGAQPQVCKYLVLLYSSTKPDSTNNEQKKYKYHWQYHWTDGYFVLWKTCLTWVSCTCHVFSIYFAADCRVGTNCRLRIWRVFTDCKSSPNFMISKITYPNLLHSCNFLCFLSMNYEWVWESIIKTRVNYKSM